MIKKKRPSENSIEPTTKTILHELKNTFRQLIQIYFNLDILIY